jgi:hypothetical protein
MQRQVVEKARGVMLTLARDTSCLKKGRLKPLNSIRRRLAEELRRLPAINVPRIP